MTQAQFVTVPILDARLHEVRAEIRVLEGKLDASIKELKADVQRLGAELNAKLAQMETRLVRWVFLARPRGRSGSTAVRRTDSM